ncbi:MAG: tetratricopeptide repeat protein [Gammaproteobacteria bacterium]|nr:tetratricopeptide repeat protein [Gammaproteobacteria bacterium]
MRVSIGLFLLLLSSFPRFALADSVDDLVTRFAEDWAVVYYQTPEASREAGFLQLVEQTERAVARYPDEAALRLWLAISRAGYAEAMGGLKSLFKAMPQLKKARAELEAAQGMPADSATEASINATLGTLYAKVPGWPVGYGDPKVARAYLDRALAADPDGLESNYFYADFLLGLGETAAARRHFEHALAAPPLLARPVADAGRRRQIREQLAQL